MKTFIIIIISVFVTFSLNAQAPSWKWEKSFGGHKDDAPGDLITDPEGNIYMSGNFSDTAIFGDSTIRESDPYIATNGFICKMLPSGKVLWLKHTDGNIGFFNFSSLTYFHHALYFTGQYSTKTLKFEQHTLTDKAVTGHSFLAKFTIDGELLWIKTIADSNSTDPLLPGKLVVDSSGHLLIEGIYSGKVTIQGQVLQAPKNVYNYYVARFDSTGILQWIKSGTQHSLSTRSTNAQGGVGICCDQQNNVYFMGNFCDTISFLEFTLIASPDAASGDFFVAKFDRDGIFHGAYNSKGKTGAHAYSICSDRNGTCTIGGYLTDRTDFGNNIVLDPLSSSEIFLVQFDNSLKPIWGYNSTAVQNSQSTYSTVENIRCDEKGDLYLVADFSGSHNFWDSTITNDHRALISAKLDNTGVFKWLLSSWQIGDFAQTSQDFLIAVDKNHDVYCAGSMVHSYYFGSADSLIPLRAWDQDHISSGVPTSDIFLAKINDPLLSVNQVPKNLSGLQAYPNPTSGIFHCELDGMYVDPSGNLIAAMYDILGRQVMDLTSLARNNNNGVTSLFTVDASKLPAGVYTIRYQLGSLSYAKQLVIAH